ncbi:MAG: hypothetical protein JWQ96_1473 [Segetibacter sp.]|nr:hypothetical protein [Segetibacter sp.]
MKRKTGHATILLFCLITISCKTTSYFGTPNSVKNVSAKVFLANGDCVNGKITVNTNYVTGGNLSVHTSMISKGVKYKLSEIRGYEINNTFYALKEIKRSARGGTTRIFMKKISRGSNDPELYENTVKNMIADKNKPATLLTRSYYIKLPQDRSNIVYSLTELERSRNFDERIMLFLNTDSELARAINSKYKRQPIPKEKRSEILMQIVQEYTGSE